MLKKIKKFFKGLLATTLSGTTTLSGIAAVTLTQASAADEWVLTIDDDAIPTAVDIKDAGSNHYWNYNGTSLFNLNNTVTGVNMSVFCIEPGVATTTGNIYSTGSDVFNNFSRDVQRKINLAGLYYQYYASGNLGSSYNKFTRAAVQWYIWLQAIQETKGYVDPYMDFAAIMANSSAEGQVDLTYIQDEYNKLTTWIGQAGVEPSFTCTSGSCTKNTSNQFLVNPGETLVFTDTNGVLHNKEWEVSPSDTVGINFTKSGDTISVSIDSNYRGNFTGKFTVSQYKSIIVDAANYPFLVFSNGGIEDYQNLVSPGYPSYVDPGDVDIEIKATTGKIIVEKYDSIYGDALANTVFEIYNSSNALEATVTTGADGKATTDWLPYGNYTVKELTPSTGYNNDNTTGKPVTINGDSISVEFQDKIIQGTVSVTKSDASTGTKLNDAIFSIYKVSGTSGVNYPTPIFITDMDATDVNGYSLSGLLDYGTYYLVEKNAAYGYYNPQTHYNFSITEEGVNVPLNITNDRQTLEINVTKLDDNSDGYGWGSVEGEVAKLSGAEFGLYQHVILRDAITGVKYFENDILVDSATSDSNGLAKFELQTSYTSDLQFDSYYYVKEIKAPIGYKLNTTPQNIVYEYGNQFDTAVVVNLTFENEINKAPIVVTKTDVETGEKLAGAVFDIYNKYDDIVDTITTDANGIAASKDLRPGNYTVTERTAPTNYQLTNVNDFDGTTTGTNSKSVEITLDGTTHNAITATTSFTNLHNKGKLTVTKVDGLTVDYETVCDGAGENCESQAKLNDDSILLPNVEFAIYAKNDLSKVVATGKTDSTGKFSVILNTGDYYLQEISAPAGYNVNPSLIAFTLSNHGDTVNKIITNMTVYGNISVYKVGETLIGASKDATSGITNLEYKNTYMAGVEFEIYANEDIYHPLTHELLFAKDSLVRSVTTGIDGKVTVSDLALGSYYVKEVNAPIGHSVYDATSNIKYITLTEEDANFEGLIEDDVTFVNERLTIDPQLYKVGAKLTSDEDKEAVYEYTALKGAIFGVYNTEAISYTDNDGNAKTIESNTLLGTMETDENGFADVQVKIPFGKYYVQEIKAPDGYYLNDKKFDFELIWSQELQKENVLIVNIADSENPIINYEIVLPKTGVNSSILFNSIGIATIALAGASIVVNKKHKSE